MLPSHLQGRRRNDNDDSDDDDDDSNHRQRNHRHLGGGAPPPGQQQRYYNSSCNQPPPLGLTGVLCDSKTLTVPNGRGTLHYTIFRPRSLPHKPPLICIAGGPCIPCTYLSPLVHLITDRSIILYDHLGSGQSQLHASSATSSTTVQDMVQDFAFLVQSIPWKGDNRVFHLYGHSFGGIIAYEYLKQQQQQKLQQNVDDSSSLLTCCCQSLILSSTPVSIPQVLADSRTLQDAIRQEMLPGETSTSLSQRRISMDGGGDDHAADLQEHDDAMQVAATFSQRHECRVQPIPLPLEQAWQMAAYASSANRGLEKVQHYVATNAPLSSDAPNDDSDASCNKGGCSGPLVPACLILRGQYDFVSVDCFSDWFPLLQAGQPPLEGDPGVQPETTETPSASVEEPQPPREEEEEKEVDGPTSTTTSDSNQEEQKESKEEEDKDNVMDEAANGDVVAGQQDMQVEKNNGNAETAAGGNHNNAAATGATGAPAPPNSTSFTCEMVTLENCSHYGMFENETLYRDTLNGFLQRHDPQNVSEFITLPNGVRVRR